MGLIILLTLFLFPLGKTAPCQVEDMGYDFSDCDLLTQTRTAYFYWKNQCSTIDGMRLFKPARGLRCDIVCQPG
jgi:hypothetical protein